MNPSNQPQPERDPIADKVIGLIEQEHVTPRPRWQFALKERVLWLAAVLALVLAAAASGVTVFAIANAGFEFYPVTHRSLLPFLADVLPFAWMAIFIAAIYIAYENVRHTGRGYRYSFVLLIVGGIVIALAGGTAVYVSGLGSEFEETVGAHIPLHKPTVEQQKQFWNQPENGLLAGEIVDISKDFSSVTIKSFDGTVWKVNGEDLRIRDCRALIQSKEIRFVGLPVKHTEANGETSVFHACFAIPWEVRGMPMHSPKMDSYSAFKPMDAVDMSNLPEVLRDTKFTSERSTDCKGVRPYQFLKTLRNEEALTL
ncbi:MAG: hypothetical protein U0487_02655 [Patescibacteria group bacterium]